MKSNSTHGGLGESLKSFSKKEAESSPGGKLFSYGNSMLLFANTHILLRKRSTQQHTANA